MKCRRAIGDTFNLENHTKNPTVHVRRRVFLSKGTLMEYSSPAVSRRVVFVSVVITICAILAGTRSYGQSTFGSILGTVRDASGAAIAGAQVTLTNLGTSAMRTETTDESGDYAFRNIDVAVYNLTITAPGFRTQTLQGIALTARETRREEAVLRVSGETQTVVVDSRAAMPVIQTDTSN